MLELNFTPYIILAYFTGVIIIGIISLIAIGILFKHAENKGVASSISITYGILFALIFLTSLASFSFS